MQEMITYFIGMFGRCIGLLSNLDIVSGVSLLAFFGAIIIIGVVVNQLVKRAGA